MQPDVPISLNTAEYDINKQLYTPCLKWANRYDRGVGYFTSGWISETARGMAEFASSGGKARWITSPILDEKDYQVLSKASVDGEIVAYFRGKLLEDIVLLEKAMETETLNAFAWMIYDEIIDMRFAVPTNKLEQGNFHDKFGIFYSGNHALSFTGSINDSIKGFNNYESIKTFRTWDTTKEYVDSDIVRFNKLWEDENPYIKLFTTDKAILNKIFLLRKTPRPYKLKNSNVKSNQWEHQEKAEVAFLKKKNGILEMATGTGKTRTAINIINHLVKTEKINRVIITTYGTDLLSQWVMELYKQTEGIHIYEKFSTENQLPSFIMDDNTSWVMYGRCCLVL